MHDAMSASKGNASCFAGIVSDLQKTDREACKGA